MSPQNLFRIQQTLYRDSHRNPVEMDRVHLYASTRQVQEEPSPAAAGAVAEGGEGAEVLLVSCPEGAGAGDWIVLEAADGREVEVRHPPPHTLPPESLRASFRSDKVSHL